MSAWHDAPAYESAGDVGPVDASDDWIPGDVPTRQEIEHEAAHRAGWCHCGQDVTL